MDNNVKNRDFQFSVPVELMQKTDKGWKIRGIASTEHRDLQGEIVKQNGLDFEYIDKGLGLFNWNHNNDPKYILGKIDSYEVKEDKTVVEGYLFEHQDNAKAVIDIMRSLKPEDKHRVQMSIEGKILERGGTDNKEIRAAKIEKVALTLDAVNPNTYTELCKSLCAPKEPEKAVEYVNVPKEVLERLVGTLNKTITAGDYSVPPGNLTGGAVLAAESLESDVKENCPKKKKKKSKTNEEDDSEKSLKSFLLSDPNTNSLFKRVLLGLKKKHPDTDIDILAKATLDLLENKLLK